MAKSQTSTVRTEVHLPKQISNVIGFQKKPNSYPKSLKLQNQLDDDLEEIDRHSESERLKEGFFDDE